MACRSIRLDLDLPPSVNAAFCNVAGKGRVRTSIYRRWQKGALAEIQAQACGMTFRGRFRLAVLASDRDLHRRRDCDNLAKPLADTLTKAGVIADDNHQHMRAIMLAWTPKLPAGRCAVTVIELPAAPGQADFPPCTRAKTQVDFLTGTRPRAKVQPAATEGEPPRFTRSHNARAKSAVPASIMAALKRRGIKVAPERVRL